MSTTTTAPTTVRSHADALAYLAAGRNHDDRPAPSGNATRLVRDGERVRVYYHQTPVLTYLPNGDVELYVAGWHTKTTAERIADYLPDVYDVEMPATTSTYGEHTYHDDGYTARPRVSVSHQDRHGRGDALHIVGRSPSWPAAAPDVRTCRRCHGRGTVSRGWAAGQACDCQDGRRDYGSTPVPVVVSGHDVVTIHPDGTTSTRTYSGYNGGPISVPSYPCGCKMCAGGFSSWQEMSAADWR